MISSTANCKQTVFESDSLPELLRQIAEWLEENPVVWDILVEPQQDEYGIYSARIIEHDPVPRPTTNALDGGKAAAELAESGIEVMSVKSVYSRRRK